MSKKVSGWKNGVFSSMKIYSGNRWLVNKLNVMYYYHMINIKVKIFEAKACLVLLTL